MNGNNVTYFDTFKVEYFPKEIETFRGNKYITTNVYRMQANDSIMYRYFCFGFTDFMLKVKCLLHDTNLFTPNEYI